MAQFLYVIRKRIKLTHEEALYCFVNNSLPAIAQVYHKFIMNIKTRMDFFMSHIV